MNKRPRVIIVKDLATGYLIPIEVKNHKINEIQRIQNKTISIITIATLINSISIAILAIKYVF